MLKIRREKDRSRKRTQAKEEIKEEKIEGKDWESNMGLRKKEG